MNIKTYIFFIKILHNNYLNKQIKHLILQNYIKLIQIN